MGDAIRIGLVTIGWIAASVAILNFLAKRESRREELSTADPEFELRRAREIAANVGSWAIWLITGVSMLLSIGAGLALFVGMLIGMLTIPDGVYLAACFACASIIYFWANRILEALVET